MKIRVIVEQEEEYEINEEVLDIFYNTNKGTIKDCLTNEMYKKAEQFITDLTGLPPYRNMMDTTKPYYVGVYAEDGIPILEY